MTKAVATEQSIEKQIQKHIGCMAGFRQLFERHHIAAATTKRLYYYRSLPSSPATEMTTTSESERSAPPSPPMSPPAAELKSTPPKSPLTLAGETKSTWKFGKEAPRLSLDSRAVTDSKGCLHPKDIRTTTNANLSATTDETQHHRSPSVIARLMGLEPLPLPLTSASGPELRRSSSESRASKDLFYSRFEDFSNNFHGFKDKSSPDADPRLASNLKSNIKQGVVTFQQNQQCKSFFDSGDVFPDMKRKTVSHYGEIENKLRMRGINQPSKDLETLRQILEALQLKGLLHSPGKIGRRNFVYDDSPLVLVKSSKSTASSTPINRRIGSDCPPKSMNSPKTRRSYGISGDISPSVSPRRKNISSPVRTARSENNRRSISLVKPRPSSEELRRRVNETAENRRVSPVHSPKVHPRRTGPAQTHSNNRSPRSKKPTAEIHRKEKTVTITTIAEDAASSVSDYSYSTSTDTERSKTEEYKDGRNLLERCGKLLHSIAEMTSTDTQPSPVSVLDSSFYKDESFTPSPVTTRRKIEFKDHHSGEVVEDDDPWSPLISPIQSKYEEDEDSDFTYISDILRASHYLPERSDLFSLLEKQRYLKSSDESKVAKLQRKLIFDIVSEIIERNKRLPPWRTVSLSNNGSIDKIWSEFRKLRDRNSAEDLFETVCVVLKEDMGGDASNGWGDCCVEASDSILDIERMVFKDLISETIRDLVAFSSRSIIVSSSPTLPRKKRVF